MNEKKYILSDDDLLELSEETPLTEGGILDDLLDAADQVAVAVRASGVNLSALDDRARSLFFMRAFYFLGVLRGGEAYRAKLLDDDDGADEPPQVHFELSDSCADLFADDLQGEPSEVLNAIYKAVDLGK